MESQLVAVETEIENIDDRLGIVESESTSSQRQPCVSVIIPTLNEANNLPHVLARVPEDIYEVVLVDGYSTDNTIEVARELRPDIKIVHQTRRGKGNALTCGFAAATGDIIVMLDADGSAAPEEIDRFVDVLLDGADFAKGSRFLSNGGGSADITHLRSLGNRGLNLLVNLLYGTRYSDLCYGYNAFWSNCLRYMNVDCDGFEVETLINVRIAKVGFLVTEVPSFEGSRIHGESNLNTFRDGWRVLRTILTERFGHVHTWASELDTRPEPEDVEPWDGMERRGDGDRRLQHDRRTGDRFRACRRGSPGRRATDIRPGFSADDDVRRRQAL